LPLNFGLWSWSSPSSRSAALDRQPRRPVQAMPDDEVEAAISLIRARCPELTSSIFDMIATARSPAT
jgi:hypothetical protein